MEVNEGLEEPKIEEPVTVARETGPETGPPWLRLGYAIEYLLALLAIFTVWSQVAGQGHVDLLPWYIKLGCALTLASCCVRFTAGLVEQNKFWGPRTVVWFTGILIVAMLMAGITYYYHLHEEQEDKGDEEATPTSFTI
jgi:heme/copper-type cytochrome/quinol oxidase subunit 3